MGKLGLRLKIDTNNKDPRLRTVEGVLTRKITIARQKREKREELLKKKVELEVRGQLAWEYKEKLIKAEQQIAELERKNTELESKIRKLTQLPCTQTENERVFGIPKTIDDCMPLRIEEHEKIKAIVQTNAYKDIQPTVNTYMGVCNHKGCSCVAEHSHGKNWFCYKHKIVLHDIYETYKKISNPETCLENHSQYSKSELIEMGNALHKIINLRIEYEQRLKTGTDRGHFFAIEKLKIALNTLNDLIHQLNKLF